MPNLWSPSRQAQHDILKAFALLTKCAIGLFEPASDGDVREILPLEGFEPYCRKIRSFSEGNRLCHDDHIRRAKKVIESGIGGLTLCYAGVFNQALPIIVDGKVMAVLMYGQMWVEGDDRCAEARDCHESVIARLKPTEDDELELRFYYDEVKRFSRADVDALNQQLSSLQRWFYGMLREEQELHRQTENVIHDLQMRLQPILARAENLSRGLRQISTESRLVEDLLAVADELLKNVLAMRVPIWNLGKFMPEYRFELYPLGTLVEEAIALYKAEAERREVDIRTRLEKPSRIEMSRVHLQQAINNLLHNAIKYSFHGRYDLDRFVDILGEIDGLDYGLTFSNYGVGILPEEFDLIFQPGYKGVLTYAEYRSGSGVGLAITKEVIERHHGTIEVESVETSGGAYVNKFIVRLPYKQPREEVK